MLISVWRCLWRLAGFVHQCRTPARQLEKVAVCFPGRAGHCVSIRLIRIPIFRRSAFPPLHRPPVAQVQNRAGIEHISRQGADELRPRAFIQSATGARAGDRNREPERQRGQSSGSKQRVQLAPVLKQVDRAVLIRIEAPGPSFCPEAERDGRG